MSSEHSQLDFAMIMASAVHDMKNSLSMVLHSLEQLGGELGESESLARRVGLLQYEAARVNNDLVQLLGLYKLQSQQLPLRVDEHFVHDFLDEQMARYELLFSNRGISCELICEADLIGYFDEELVAGIVNNILANAIRYTRTKIQVEARQIDDYLILSINDDGTGFPARMLNAMEQPDRGINFDTGSTNLGLYFARQIAALHQQDDRRGSIELTNGGPLGGGLFRLLLP